MSAKCNFLGNAQQLRSQQSTAKVCRAPVAVKAQSREQVRLLDQVEVSDKSRYAKTPIQLGQDDELSTAQAK